MNPYEQKRQARIDRLRDAGQAAANEASALEQRADAMASVIPLGQPILIGHYSERRDRNYRAKISRTYDRALEAADQAKDLARRADAAESSHAISADDPDAPAKLRERIASLRAHQVRMVALNRAWRTGGEAGLVAAGLSSEGAAKIAARIAAAYSWERQPFAAYQLQNASANIRRLEERLKTIEARVAVPAAEEDLGGGMRLEVDPEANRVRLRFPGKPETAVRTALKRAGFRWAPSTGAWQGYLSEAMVARARQIAGSATVAEKEA